MTGQLDEVLAPKPIHNLAEHDQVEETEDFEQEHEISDEHHDSSDHGHETVHESGIHGKSTPCIHSYISLRGLFPYRISK